MQSGFAWIGLPCSSLLGSTTLVLRAIGPTLVIVLHKLVGVNGLLHLLLQAQSKGTLHIDYYWSSRSSLLTERFMVMSRVMF